MSETFPKTRLRRLRSDDFIRRLVAENRLSADDFIYPIFVSDSAKNAREPIASMPGIFRLGMDSLLHESERALNLGLPAVAIFPAIESSKKSPRGEESHNPNGLVQRAVASLKKRFPALGVVCDVALDPYTSHGQDGILTADGGDVANDETIGALILQALSLAEAGCGHCCAVGYDGRTHRQNSRRIGIGGISSCKDSRLRRQIRIAFLRAVSRCGGLVGAFEKRQADLPNESRQHSRGDARNRFGYFRRRGYGDGQAGDAVFGCRARSEPPL